MSTQVQQKFIKNYIKQYELLTQFQHNFNTIFDTNTGGII